MIVDDMIYRQKVKNKKKTICDSKDGWTDHWVSSNISGGSFVAFVLKDWCRRG